MEGLLARRARLVDDLAVVDGKIAELRRRALRDAVGGAEASGVGRLPVRGEELRAARLDLPAGIDGHDVERRLAAVAADERRAGRPLDGLEILVEYRLNGGGVLAVRTRRAGLLDWVEHFEASSD